MVMILLFRQLNTSFNHRNTAYICFLNWHVSAIHKAKKKGGSVVEYVQLANNVWNEEKGFAQAQVIHSFGRSDQLDIEL